MSDIHYEKKKVIHTCKRIIMLLFSKPNILLPILLIPLLIGSSFANKMSIKASEIFIDILKKKENVTLQDYITLYIKSELFKVFLTAIYDLLISRFYSTAQSAVLFDYMSLEYNEFRKYSIGNLSLRHFEKSESVAVLIYTLFPELFINTDYLIQAMKKVYDSDSKVAFTCLTGSLIVHMCIFSLLLKSYNKYQKNYTAAKVQISSVVSNEVSNFDIIKTFNMEDGSVERVSKANQARKEAKIKMSLFTGKMNFLYSTIEILVLLTIFILASFGIGNGSLYSIFTFSTGIHKSLRSFLKNLIRANESFYTFYLLESDIKAPEDGTDSLTDFEEIEAKKLEFENVFSNLDFKINKNEKIAIIGENSCGKTILIKILAGFVPFKGELLINGNDIKKYKKFSIRDQFTVISQNESYTQGSIMRNLKYGNNLFEDEIIQKCKEWNVHNIIESIDGGYNKHSSSGGSELSGGQKQRIAVMRGILRDRPVLIVDDAMSGISTLDKNNLISKILDQENKTIIMVLKSPEFIDKFDKILYINGNGSMFGTAEELKNTVSEFFNQR